jgi:hypothetical protein
MSWPTAHTAVVEAAEAAAAEPQPTSVLAIDETRRGRVRWTFSVEHKRWVMHRRHRPGFVDLAGHQGGSARSRAASAEASSTGSRHARAFPIERECPHAEVAAVGVAQTHCHASFGCAIAPRSVRLQCCMRIRAALWRYALVRAWPRADRLTRAAVQHCPRRVRGGADRAAVLLRLAPAVRGGAELERPRTGLQIAACRRSSRRDHSCSVNVTTSGRAAGRVS